jgi:hypothetical protein
MSPNGHPEQPEQSAPYSPVRMTVNEFQDIALFFKRFLAENPLLKALIIAAGVGGVFETLHCLWLALRYVFRF